MSFAFVMPGQDREVPRTPEVKLHGDLNSFLKM